MTFSRRGFLGALSAAVIAVAIEVLPGAKKTGVERPWTPTTRIMRFGDDILIFGRTAIWRLIPGKDPVNMASVAAAAQALD